MRLKQVLAVMAVVCLCTAGFANTVQAQDGLTPGVPTEGALRGDQASYTLAATAGQMIVVRVESDAFDAEATLLDPAGMEVAYDDDSGGESNPQLATIAQADGPYTVVVTAWSSGDGPFTITADLVDPLMIDVGGTATLMPDGANPLYAAFSGAADSVVNVYATAQMAEDDTKLTLTNVDGAEIADDDDSGPGYNPYLRRVMLPDDGMYLIKLESLFEEPLTGPVDLTVEPTEPLQLSDTPQTVELNPDELEIEVFTFEVTAGTAYRITVESALETGMELTLLGTNEWFDPGLTADNAMRVMWDYRAEVTGTLRLEVRPAFLSDGDTLTLTLEVLG